MVLEIWSQFYAHCLCNMKAVVGAFVVKQVDLNILQICYWNSAFIIICGESQDVTTREKYPSETL